MVKTKILIALGVLIALGGTGLAIYWMWQDSHKNDAAATYSQTLSASTGAVNQTPVADQGLTNQDSGQSAAAQTLGGQTDAQQPSSLIDPSSFTQYEKYKNDKQALYADIQKGTGAELTVNKKAAVLYKGWLTNGKVFEQSRADSSGKLQPIIFTLGAHQVISGWEQAMVGMKAGGTRLLIVPPAAGYGSVLNGSIPANSVLVFEVQLLAVQ